MNDFDDLPGAGENLSQDHDSQDEAQNTQQTQQPRGGSYADEIFSEKLVARNRIFYIDVKESHNGRFLKVSEKSRGRRSTIMMDQEDVAAFIETLQKAQAQF